jgi:hypothetical protein
MKKSTLLASLLLAAAGFSGVASAHPYAGGLGTVATATDKFYLVCATGSAKITYAVKRTSGTGNISIEGSKAGFSATPAPALSTSSGATLSPLKTIKGGAGAYFFTVKKSPAASGTRGWYADIHCYDTNGQHNPDDQSASVTYTQNQ